MLYSLFIDVTTPANKKLPPVASAQSSKIERASSKSSSQRNYFYDGYEKSLFIEIFILHMEHTLTLGKQ